MKSKLALPALIVSCSVALFGAYVVYAQRQAQPSALDVALVSVPASVSETHLPTLDSSGETEALVITGSNIEGPIFRSSSLPLTWEETATPPSPTDHSPPTQSGSFETVRFRADGSTVTTRMAPAKPAQTDGRILKPGTFRTSIQPKLIGVLPSVAPGETVPNPARQKAEHDSAAQTATPRPRLLAPGSKAMDLRILEQPPASPKTEPSAPAAESLALDKPTAS
jgi:hypothetical protein